MVLVALFSAIIFV